MKQSTPAQQRKKLSKTYQKTPKEKSQGLLWSSLTDSQKAQLLLGSTGLSNHNEFIQRFKSYEQPDID